jgi:hypothetical protein
MMLTTEQSDEDPKGKMVHAGEARPRTEIPSKRDDEKPMRRGASTGANFDGTVDGKEMLSGVANEGTDKQNASVTSSPGVGQKSGGDKKSEGFKVCMGCSWAMV